MLKSNVLVLKSNVLVLKSNVLVLKCNVFVLNCNDIVLKFCSLLLCSNQCTLFQHDCQYCGRLFTSKRKMSEHARMCAFCDNCKIFTDLRHVAKCQTPKPRKMATVRCPSCRAFKSKLNLPRHMLSKHGIPNWKNSEHPELVSVVSFILICC